MELNSSIAELQRENESLRREIAKLEDLRALTYRDGLTGLWNRRYFAERLGAELSRARRAGSRPFTVLILDVNDFRVINKSHGPTEGDLLLRWVAEFLEKSVRAHDVCCRIEADEFAVILADMTRLSCGALLGRLRDKLATLTVRSPFAFGLSMGTASFPDQGTTFDALVRGAEEARFLDKRSRSSQQGPILPGMDAPDHAPDGPAPARSSNT
jgi:diguanylate cyclase (GGDEF)-like protein